MLSPHQTAAAKGQEAEETEQERASDQPAPSLPSCGCQIVFRRTQAAATPPSPVVTINGKQVFLSMTWRDRITSDTQILRGKPCIRGTRIPAALVLGYLASGLSHQEIQSQFPGISSDDIAACLDYARELADFESPLAA